MGNIDVIAEMITEGKWGVKTETKTTENVDLPLFDI
jgi:hypothetical protein